MLVHQRVARNDLNISMCQENESAFWVLQKLHASFVPSSPNRTWVEGPQNAERSLPKKKQLR